MPATLTPREAAAYLRVSLSKFAKMRAAGTGPIAHKYGHRTVRYDVADLEAWKDARVSA